MGQIGSDITEAELRQQCREGTRIIAEQVARIAALEAALAEAREQIAADAIANETVRNASMEVLMDLQRELTAAEERARVAEERVRTAHADGADAIIASFSNADLRGRVCELERENAELARAHAVAESELTAALARAERAEAEWDGLRKTIPRVDAADFDQLAEIAKQTEQSRKRMEEIMDRIESRPTREAALAAARADAVREFAEWCDRGDSWVCVEDIDPVTLDAQETTMGLVAARFLAQKELM